MLRRLNETAGWVLLGLARVALRATTQQKAAQVRTTVTCWTCEGSGQIPCPDRVPMRVVLDE